MTFFSPLLIALAKNLEVTLVTFFFLILFSKAFPSLVYLSDKIYLNLLTPVHLHATPGVQAAVILPWAKAVIVLFPFFFL